MDKTLNEMTLGTLRAIVREANEAGMKKAQEMFDKIGERDACGFGWCEIYVKGNTKLGRKMAQLEDLGVRKSWRAGEWTAWSRFGSQSISVNEAFGFGFAEVMKKYGFTAYGCSRMD